MKAVKNTQSYSSILAAVLLCILTAQAMTSIPQLSVTFDEPAHITTGYSIWETRDLRLVEDHPPFLQLWMSWPLHLSPLPPTTSEVSNWETGYRHQFAYDEAWWSTLPVDHWIVPARLTVTWLSVILGALLFQWAHEWFGPSAALLSLSVFAFSPNILAHASLATLDLGISVLIFASMYACWRLLICPSYGRAALLGLCLGLALAAKISAFILVPVTGLWILVYGWRNWSLPSLFRLLPIYAGVSGLTLWAAHLFHMGAVAEIPFVVPAPTFWDSLLNIWGHISTANRRAFLLGNTYSGGIWYYFPIAFLIKTPIPTLLLTFTAVVNLGARRHLRHERLLYLLSLPTIYSVTILMSEMNIGYRHLLPILPFLHLLIGSIFAPIVTSARARWAPAFSAIAIAWLAFEALTIWPYHLTYFNQIVGGAQNGYRVMTDSNVDWNQGLKAVRHYLDKHQIAEETVYISTLAPFVPLEQYGLGAVTPLPPTHGSNGILPSRYEPAPGIYILSASTYQGLVVGYPEMYNWFHHRPPDDVIGNAMLVYHVRRQPQRSPWVAQCGTPVPPLTPEMLVERFGSTELRNVTFDCTQTWIYPTGGRDPGWFAVPQSVLTQTQPFVQYQLQECRISFVQRSDDFGNPHTVYECTRSPILPSEWITQVAQEKDEGNSKGSFIGGFVLLGHRLARNRETLQVYTIWEITEEVSQPMGPTVWLMVDGQLLATHTGLGMNVEELRPDDQIVQRHEFDRRPLHDSDLELFAGVVHPKGDPLPLRESEEDSTYHIWLQSLSLCNKSGGITYLRARSSFDPLPIGVRASP